MATADLKLVYGGGASFVPSFFSGRLQIASGSSGNLAVITPPAGKRVRLVGLLNNPASNINESAISVIADGVVVVNGLSLTPIATSSPGQFYVGNSVTTSGFGQGIGNIDFIEANTSITIRKDSGSTVSPIVYSYAFGD